VIPPALPVVCNASFNALLELPVPGNTPPELLSRALQILLALVTTVDERGALLTEAFYLHDPLLYARIDR
jgi:hypothetical protein